MIKDYDLPIGWMLHPLRPYGPYTEAQNLMRAKRWMRWLLRVFPDVDTCADWILWCELLDDSNPVERARGLKYDNEMVRRLDLVWLVGGHESSGMHSDAVVAKVNKKARVDLLALGEEPPRSPMVIANVRSIVMEAIVPWWKDPQEELHVSVDGR